MRKKPSIALILFLIVAIGIPAIVLTSSTPPPVDPMSAVVLSTPLIIFLFVRAYRGLKRGSSRKVTGIAFGLAGVVLSGLVISSFESYSEYTQARQPLWEAVVPVCQGKTNSGSAAYTPGRSAPLMAIDVAVNETKWSKRVARWGWEPETSGEVALVACFTESEVELETCRYGHAGQVELTRHRDQVAVRLVEAASGRVLGEQVFLGEERQCPSSISASSRGELRGGDVAQAEVQAWLEPFFKGAVQPGQ